MHNTHPIETSLQSWLSQHPESFHPSDMKRFYIFVKNVCRYGRKTRDGMWLKKQISKRVRYFSQENLDKFCTLFEELQDFYKTEATPTYEIQL